MGKLGRGRYVFLDLGDNFTTGKVVRLNPHMITLQVYRGKRCFRPSYSRSTVHQVIPIDPSVAKALGPFSYPPDPHRLT
jgi:hypothetical protein